MMGYYGFGYGIGLFGWILRILFWGAVIWLIVFLVHKHRQTVNNASDKTPMEILKARYAKGEISKKEYFEMKSELSKK